MIIGFLGKGGSGKSTVATQMALWLHNQGKEVLAIDADHNMDLVFNLSAGDVPTMRHLGSARKDLFAHLQAPDHVTTFREAFLESKEVSFRFASPDAFTDTYTTLLRERLRVMSAGPQTEDVLRGGMCSHSLSAPLKVYLPLLAVLDEQAVVVDEKAGADGVSTGTVTGFDLAVIVVEPSLHSVKTATQIRELLAEFGVPGVVVANKVSTPEDRDYIESALGETITLALSSDSSIGRAPGDLVASWHDTLAAIHDKAAEYLPSRRYTRSLAKFQNQA